MASFITPLETFENHLYDFHIKVPNEIAEQFIEGTFRRVICTFNGGFQHHAALMSYGEGWYILMSKATRKKIGAVLGMPIEVHLRKEDSEYGMPMPEEFAALLEEDEEGSHYFHQLTPGKQRSLIYMVRKVKNVDIKLKKGLAILHHLKEVEGKLDYKGLNQTFKAFNQRYKL